MPVLRSVWSGIKSLLRKEERNREINEELQGYLHAAVDDKVRRGMRREDAERAARVEVGSIAVVRHRVWRLAGSRRWSRIFRRGERRRSILLLPCAASSESQFELALRISRFYRLGNKICTSGSKGVLRR